MFDDRILIFAAHPDDAEIAAGGTICRMSGEGKSVRVVNATSSGVDFTEATLRMNASAKAIGRLGGEVRFLAGGQFKQVGDIPSDKLVSYLDAAISDFLPDTILTHSQTDSHQDHRLLSQAVVSSSRRTKAAVLSFCPAEHRAAGSNWFRPNLWIDISDYIEKKIDAIEEHNLEGTSYAKIDSDFIRLRARYEGASRQVEYAEAFELQRGII